MFYNAWGTQESMHIHAFKVASHLSQTVLRARLIFPKENSGMSEVEIIKNEICSCILY